MIRFSTNTHLLRILLPILVGVFAIASPLEAIENKRVRVQVIGIPDSVVKNHLITATNIPAFRADKTFWQEGDLRRAVQEEIPRWKQTLQAYGYFDAEIRVDVKTTSYCFVIELSVAPGKVYKLTDISLLLDSGENNFVPTPLPTPVLLPQIASSQNIEGIEKALLKTYQCSGYAQACFLLKQLEVNTVEKTVEVVWKVQRGPFFTFGPIVISGLERIHPKFVRRKLLIREGTPYNLGLIEQTQAGLETSGNFSAVAVSPDWTLAQDSSLPVSVALSESAPRTIAFGASVMTESGIGGRVLWENRNLTGEGDTLAVRGYSSKRQKTAALIYTRPDFLANQTNLRLQLEHKDEKSLPYDDRGWLLGSFLERRLNKRLFFSYGISWQYLETMKSQDNSRKGLVNLPFTFTWNNATNPLNPMDGRSHQLLLTPTMTLEETPIHFVKIILKNGFYYPVADWLCMAFGLQGGTILGAQRSQIPTPLRFFEGGPTSFRGYKYKTVSPLSTDNTPEGGRSYFLGSFEPRFLLGDNLAVIPFYEIGRVYTGEVPTLESRHANPRGNLRSVGLGISYNTLVGPIRFDYAAPLNRRRGIDHSFEIYLSVGPAF